MSSNFINQLNTVLKNQLKHTKKEEKPAGDFFTHMKFKFAPKNPNKFIKYTEPITYLKRFKPFLYYEWSKRKQMHEQFNFFVSCVVVSEMYIYRYDDIFNFDEKTDDILLKIDTLDNILSFFYFPNVEVYFCLENENNRKGDKPHILKDLLRMKEEEFLKNYGFCNVIKELGEMEELVKTGVN